MFQLMVFFLLCTIFNNGVSAYTVQNKEKCSLSDMECQRKYYVKVIETAAATGIPEFGIPVLDPYVFENMEVTVMDLIKVKVTAGTAEGLKTCSTKSYSINWKTQTTYVEYVCKVVKVQGKYKLEGTDALKQLIGDINIYGKGVASLKIENVQFNVQVPMEVKRFKDGEAHGVIDAKKVKYTYEVLGKATLEADNLFIGDQNISTVAVKIFNENWKLLTKLFGGPAIDWALEVFSENANKYLTAVPFKEIYSDDLSAYITN